jgi:hypothetical protein
MDHDIHEFVRRSQKELQEEYDRIQKRATEDPGTAGDQGEENWATLFREWLPRYFHIITKGRILTDTGYASPQIDLLVLYPSYPQILLDKKLYLSGGVAAAFECKTTLTAAHIKEAVETSAALKRAQPCHRPQRCSDHGALYRQSSFRNPQSHRKRILLKLPPSKSHLLFSSLRFLTPRNQAP